MRWKKTTGTRLANLTTYVSRRIYTIVLIGMTSCLEPYSPPEITGSIDILVVDGFLNSSDNSATVRLSKAKPLSDETNEVIEVSALVQIEDENGNSQSLEGISGGYYSSSQMQLSAGTKYRLSIVRDDGRRYYSDFITLTTCPPIDSISWKPSAQSPGINIYANTHDDTGQTKYFQWTFDETWEYTSRYGSFYKIVNGAVALQDIPMYRCWISKPSTAILVHSTAQLLSNTVREFPLTFIPVLSQKVSIRYSILVQQRAITKEAHDFWSQLKKSTENLGSLFDPLPSQVLGNVYSADDGSEPVLGYFSGGQVASKRIFIGFHELPLEIRLQPVLPCPVDSIPNASIPFYSNTNLISTYGAPFPEGYTRSPGKNCMDCRDDGGNPTRPDYWN